MHDESLRDIVKRGGRPRDFIAEALPPQSLASLRAACAADPAVEEVWLLWVTYAGHPDELLALVRLSRSSRDALFALCARIDAIGIGQSMAQEQRGPRPQRDPFYERLESPPQQG